MNWQNVPIGIMRRDELLNALLAIWKTQYNITARDSSEFSKGYLTGFEEGLDAIAQIAGLLEGFETGKAIHCTKTRENLDSKAKLIDGHQVITFLDAY